MVGTFMGWSHHLPNVAVRLVAHELGSIGRVQNWSKGAAAAAGLRKVIFRLIWKGCWYTADEGGSWGEAKKEKKGHVDEVGKLAYGLQSWQEAFEGYKEHFQWREYHYGLPSLEQALRGGMEEILELMEALLEDDERERRAATMDEAGDVMYCAMMDSTW